MAYGTGGAWWKRLAEPEMIVALSAVVLGVCALAVSVAQVRIMREEQHAAVWPRVQIGRSYSAASNVEVLIANFGIGPAVIRDVRVDVDGEAVVDWGGAFRSLLSGGGPGDITLSTVSGRILPAGDVIRAFRSTDPGFAHAFAAAGDRIRMRICYCSLYGQCWWAMSAFGDAAPTEPQPSASCGLTESSFRD